MIPWGGGGSVTSSSFPYSTDHPTSLVPTILSPRELALRGGLHQKTSRGAGQGTVWQVLNSEGDGSRNSGTWKEHDTFTMILFIMSLCLLRTEKVTPLQVPPASWVADWGQGETGPDGCAEAVQIPSRSVGPLLWVSSTHSTSELAPGLPTRLGPARAH